MKFKKGLALMLALVLSISACTTVFANDVIIVEPTTEEETTEPARQYTVTFIYEDKVLETKIVNEGDMVIPPVVYKEGYTTRYDEDLTNVKSNMIVNITTHKNLYEVLVVNDEKVISVQSIFHGQEAVEQKLYKKGYKYVWDKAFDNITDDTVINAVWLLEEYSLHLYDSDLTQLAFKKFTINDAINLSEVITPKKVGYEFAGWYEEPDYSGNRVTTINQGTDKSINLYAKWNKVSTAKVKINKVKRTADNKKILINLKKVNKAQKYTVYYSTDMKTRKPKKITSKSRVITLKNLKQDTYYVKVVYYTLDSANKKVYSVPKTFKVKANKIKK